MTFTKFWENLSSANSQLQKLTNRIDMTIAVFKSQLQKAFDAGEKQGQKTGYSKGYRAGFEAGKLKQTTDFGSMFEGSDFFNVGQKR